MPYITQEDRELLKYFNNEPQTAGELNYMFSLIAKKYIDSKGLSYSTINDIVGALEGAKLEFYRRVAAPYEDEKIEENGDVYFVEEEHHTIALAADVAIWEDTTFDIEDEEIVEKEPEPAIIETKEIVAKVPTPHKGFMKAVSSIRDWEIAKKIIKRYKKLLGKNVVE